MVDVHYFIMQWFTNTVLCQKFDEPAWHYRPCFLSHQIFCVSLLTPFSNAFLDNRVDRPRQQHVATATIKTRPFYSKQGLTLTLVRDHWSLLVPPEHGEPNVRAPVKSPYFEFVRLQQLWVTTINHNTQRTTTHINTTTTISIQYDTITLHPLPHGRGINRTSFSFHTNLTYNMWYILVKSIGGFKPSWRRVTNIK